MPPSLIEACLNRVSKPARYIGGEWHMIKKDSKDKVRFALAFPDVYEVGMSHLGSRILYHILNEREDTYCERVYAPWVDMEAEMRQRGVKLFALESQEPIANFDFIGFSLPYELSYTNILYMLDLSGLPLLKKDRTADMPFVIAGGSCAFNPEPLVDFVDFFVIGDGEEVIDEIINAYQIHRKRKKSRLDFLRQVAQIKGIYVPEFYKADYNEQGILQSFHPAEEGIPSIIQKCICQDFENAFIPEKIIVPHMGIIHDRVTLEIFRGCTRGCRFCQAGMIYRPVRNRSQARILKSVQASLAETGYEEVSLSSLSTGDYPNLEPLVENLIKAAKKSCVSVSLPSLRLDSFNKEVAEELQKIRKTGLTFAPEAGTQRLRDVINKNITEDDYEKTLSGAFEAGWFSVKLYYMMGLPTETQSDLDGIADMVKTALSLYRQRILGQHRKPLEITVSTSNFVPKPFTPFQWMGQTPVEELQKRQHYIKEKLKLRGVTYNWHDSETSLLEAVFARGDRRLSPVLLKAYQLGCKFDGWRELFSFKLWQQAFDDCSVSMAFYAHRERTYGEILPWGHIDAGVDEAFLWQEYQKALQGQTTLDCRQNCLGCGILNLLDKGVCPCA